MRKKRSALGTSRSKFRLSNSGLHLRLESISSLRVMRETHAEKRGSIETGPPLRDRGMQNVGAGVASSSGVGLVTRPRTRIAGRPRSGRGRYEIIDYPWVRQV